MNLMEDQQASQSAQREAKVITLCGSATFEAEFAEVNQRLTLADEVYIVDPGGYVGESTRREIAYAESLGKPVRYLSRERSRDLQWDAVTPCDDGV